MKRITVVVAVWLASGSGAIAQNAFSCPWGKDGACLDYGDKVCSSSAMCIDSTATCFNSGTCDYDGFICKSDYNDLADKAKAIADNYDGMKTCLMKAITIDDAKGCGLIY